MESDSFSLHHPHTFGDYFSRALVLVVYRFARTFFRDDYAQHALVLEVVLASLQTSIAAHVQYTALRNLRADRVRIEELLGEVSAEHFHIIVLKRATKLSWYGKAAIWKMQFVFTPIFRFIFALSPSFAYRTIAYAEERLAGIYADWLLHIMSNASENIAAPAVATKYWELEDGALLTDVLNILISETAKHRDHDHLRADE